MIVLLLLCAVSTVFADERSLRISDIDIHARIDSSGDMYVAETDKYVFDGAFNGIYIDLDSRSSDGIVDFQAFDVTGRQEIPLRFELSNDGDSHRYKVYSQSENETKTFRINYTVKNAVQVYADTAELYWKFFDERNENELEAVQVKVELPAGVRRENMLVYGHGPLHGDVTIADDGIALYRISPLPPGRMFEVRVLFPGEYVPDSTRVSNEAKLEAIQEEEYNWVEPVADDSEVSVLGALGLLIANLTVGFYLKYYRRAKSLWSGKYYRELPSDISPAAVSYLMDYRLETRDLMATMVDLIRRGYVQIHHEKRSEGRKSSVEYKFRLLKSNTTGLLAHERELIAWFFGQIGNENTVSLSEIREYAKMKDKASIFVESWTKWQESVKNEIERHGYLHERKKPRRLIQYAIVAQLLIFLVFAPDSWAWLVIFTIPLFFLVPKKIQRTPDGQTEYAKWRAFQRFIRDYSRMETREPLAVHLWGHYFVYAIPLGVATKMNEIARLPLPQGEQGLSMIDDSFVHHHSFWTNSFDKSVRDARSNIPSSSNSDGSGGSFSSGGGGGGGGGGRGGF